MSYLARAAVALCLGACAPLEVVEEHKLVVRAPEAGLSTSLPAKVSLFFTVERANGAPVTGLTSDAFEIREDDAPVSPLESQQVISRRGEAYRMDSLLMLDMSGSVLRSGSFPKLVSAAGHYVDEVLAQGAGQAISVMTFDGRPQPHPVAGFTGDAASLKAALSALLNSECRSHSDCAGFSDRRTCAAFRCVDDSTNLFGAVTAGLSALDARLRLDDSIKHKDAALVLFTDGSDQAARVPATVAVNAVATSPVKVLTVGLGTEVDRGVLESLGKSGSFAVQDAAELETAFRAAATEVVAQANKSYVLEYCSPRRSGTHRLTVKVTTTDPSMPLTGSLSGTFDATGFTSGCAL